MDADHDKQPVDDGQDPVVVHDPEAPSSDLANVSSETREIDLSGDGNPDGFRSVTTEIHEHDLDGDGEPDVYETVTVEQTSIDVDGDGVPDVVTTVETSEIEMDLTGDGDIDSFELTEVRTVAHDIDGDGMPNVTRTEVVTASGIDPENGTFKDVEASGVRLYGLDTTGDGVIDDLVAEELDVEIVEDDETSNG